MPEGQLTAGQKRRVVVVGAGIVGISTSWSLAQRGCDVTVLEAADSPCTVASFANAGRFCIARVPFIYKNNNFKATMDIVKALILPRALYQKMDGEGRSLPSQVIPSLSLIPFGVWFLRNCTQERNNRNAKAFADLARLSHAAMDNLIKKVGMSAKAMGRTEKNLWIHSIPGQFDSWPAVIKSEGLGELELLDADACAKRYPESGEFVRRCRSGCALAHCDWSADARKVGQLVANATEAKFIYGARVTGLRYDSQGRANAVAFSSGQNDAERVVHADDIVICAGRATDQLTKGACILPLTSMRGLSVELLDVRGGPDLSICDYGSNSFSYQFTPFEPGHARLVGFADFNHESPGEQELKEMTDRFLEYSKTIYPGMTWKSVGIVHSCWRPMSPDSLPIVSPVQPGSNIWLNCGHGAVGWTYSAATAELTAAGITGCCGAQDEKVVSHLLKAFSAERFSLRSFFS